jgi:hypothetical protein
MAEGLIEWCPKQTLLPWPLSLPPDELPGRDEGLARCN